MTGAACWVQVMDVACWVQAMHVVCWVQATDVVETTVVIAARRLHLSPAAMTTPAMTAATPPTYCRGRVEAV